ncbi:hypothetical protein V1527DRAFT_415651 [Lipomyces starkeyi]
MSPRIAPNASERDAYERPLHFLKANKPENMLDIHLSYFGALEIQAQALYGNSKYPRAEYSATDSKVTIHAAPTALHSSAALSLQDYISDCIRDVLVQHGRQSVLDLLVPVGDTTTSPASVDQGTASFVIEVGVSEGYRALNADIMLWLNQLHCRTTNSKYFDIPGICCGAMSRFIRRQL